MFGRVLLSVAVVLGMVGCSNGRFFEGAAGTITQAALTDSTILSEMKNAVATNVGSAPSQLPSLNFSREGNAFDACTTRTPATTVDGDSDGTPLEEKREYNCTDVAQSHTKTSIKGNYKVVDKDDANAAGGFRYELNNIERTYTSTTTRDGSRYSGSYKYNGYFDLTRNGASYAYDSNYQGSGRSEGNDSRESVTEYTWGSSWSHTYEPDDAANPNASGKITMSGFFGYTNTNTSDPTKNVNFVLKVVSTDLKYKGSSCASFFESGSIAWTDASNNTVTWTYTNCARTCKINDTTYTCN